MDNLEAILSREVPRKKTSKQLYYYGLSYLTRGITKDAIANTYAHELGLKKAGRADFARALHERQESTKEPLVDESLPGLPEALAAHCYRVNISQRADDAVCQACDVNDLKALVVLDLLYPDQIRSDVAPENQLIHLSKEYYAQHLKPCPPVYDRQESLRESFQFQVSGGYDAHRGKSAKRFDKVRLAVVVASLCALPLAYQVRGCMQDSGKGIQHERTESDFVGTIGSYANDVIDSLAHGTNDGYEIKSTRQRVAEENRERHAYGVSSVKTIYAVSKGCMASVLEDVSTRFLDCINTITHSWYGKKQDD
ncbi:MAG: hypothetical protein ACQESG_07150 [Nanobdellota archaeon]